MLNMPKEILTSHDQESLNAIATRLERVATTLKSLSVDLEKYSIDTVAVTHHDQLTRGMKYIENFASAARKRMYSVLEERGYYKAESDARPNASD